MSSVVYPLYTQHADLWSLVAPLEAYEDEMLAWVELISRALAHEDDLEVLDLGTGGGHHLHHLVRQWPSRLSGVASDISAPMLELAAPLLRGFETLQADMTTLRLERKFPLVTVHDSFCYLTSIDQVQALLGTVAYHLQPGGLALIKVDALADDFVGPYRYLTNFEDERREVTLTHYEWDPDPNDSWLEVIYLFLERSGGQVVSREERHRLGLFSRAQLKAAWQGAGLEGDLVSMDRWDDDRPNPLLILRPAEGESNSEQNQELP